MIAVQTGFALPVELPTTLYLNDVEVLTIQTTPVCLEDWALGYLYTEGLIGAVDDLRQLVVDETRGLVWADVAPDPVVCGVLQPVGHRLRPTRPQISAWMRRMLQQCPLYAESGGMHAAAAVHAPTGEMLVREDIGRHGAIDKVIGAMLRAGWRPAEVAILTSGRISLEMCTKLARTGIPLAASRTAATTQAFALAMQLGIDLIGYVRGDQMIMYTNG